MRTRSEWDPNRYVDVSNQQMQWALETLQNAALRGNEDILDVGCGDGKITASIAEITTGRVLGIDRSRTMIAYAKQTHECSDKPNLQFDIGEAETYRPQMNVHIIVSFTALHWVSDHQTLLGHFNDILADAGKLVLQFPGQGNAEPLIEVAFEIMNDSQWKPYFTDFRFPWSFFAVDQYTEWLKQAGFRPHDVKLLGKAMAHQGTQGLAAWMKATWLPFTERVPSSEHEAFLSAITDRYCRQFAPDKTGTVYTQMYRLQVIADKDRSDIP